MTRLADCPLHRPAGDGRTTGRRPGCLSAAFRANDFATADKLTTKAFSTVNGDLCSTVSIDSYTHPTHPATTNGEMIYGITLHVVGRSKDGTIPAGDLQWFYTLQHQTDGSWRLIGGGTGP